jgi:hypothetical protein
MIQLDSTQGLLHYNTHKPKPASPSTTASLPNKAVPVQPHYLASTPLPPSTLNQGSPRQSTLLSPWPIALGALLPPRFCDPIVGSWASTPFFPLTLFLVP